MRWITGRINKTVSIKDNIQLNINKIIPGDLFHLEFDSIDTYKNHKDQEYLYIISDTLDNYDIIDTVPLLGTFFIKYDGELVNTSIVIADYISTR